LLDDPLYIGLRQRRVTGKKYAEFIDEFMNAIATRFGYSCLIQFEDFASHNAYRLLEKYRTRYCTFNDDIQGTAAVALGGLLATLRINSTKLEDNRILFVGAGQAATGIADLTALAISRKTGCTFEEACEKYIFMTDVNGLLAEGRPEGFETDAPQNKYIKKNYEPSKDLTQTIENVKPTALIGATGVAQIFTESALKKMAEINKRPVIFALSNPTSKAECTATQAIEATDGRCIFSSGSPFSPVEYKGKTFYPSQGNNAYIFPGVALATIVCSVYNIDEQVFLVAAEVSS
jgi:malate dehydrogenase (oxaloacetate-decarboxylating)(NADP+)